MLFNPIDKVKNKFFPIFRAYPSPISRRIFTLSEFKSLSKIIN